MQEIIDRLLHFEPIQYIFGHTLWMGLDLKVTPATLIPRPETAEMVNKVENLNLKIERPTVLDIGTGSGCIAIALKKRHPQWRISGIDISKEAIAVAQENAERNDAEVEFEVADIFGFNGKKYDIVVSNPPYVCESEKTSMKSNVLNYEPASALFVKDDDPLRFYRQIASLRMGGQVWFEINEAFGLQMSELMESLGYADIRLYQDSYGKCRFLHASLQKN